MEIIYNSDGKIVKKIYENGEMDEFDYDSNGNLIKQDFSVPYGHGFSRSIIEYDSDGYMISFRQPYKNSTYTYDSKYRYEHKLDGDDNIIETVKTTKNKEPDI